MKLFIKLVAVILVLSVSKSVGIAQDIHFSQFYMSPLNLNPAMTGVNNCKTRLVANYRNQWASPLGGNAYNTYSVSYDQKVAVGRSDYFGIGGTLWGDRAGQSNFGSTQGRLSFSYSKKVGGYRKSARYFVVGADAGITQRSVRDGDLRWGTQHNGMGGFDPTLPPDPNITDFDFLYADVSAGLLFFNVLDEYNNWYLGAAMAHLNQPNVSFYDNDDVTLYTRTTIHGGGQFEISRGTSILPNFVVFLQGEQREYNLGTSIRFDIGTRSLPQSWQIGGWFRAGTKETFSTDGSGMLVSEGGFHADAIIISTRFNYDQFGIGFSYDATISDFRDAGSAVGAFEFSLNYFICGPERRAVYCPRF